MFLTLINEEEKMSLVKKFFDFFFSPKKEEKKWEPPKRTREEIIKKIKFEHNILSMLALTEMSYEKKKEYKEDCSIKISELENELLGVLSDEFEKVVLKSIVSQRFDLLEFFGENADMSVLIKEGFDDIAKYLDPSHPLNYAKIPRSGKEILFWMLEFGIGTSDISEAINKISSSIVIERKILDLEISEDVSQRFVSIFLVVVLSTEYGGRFRFLLNIAKTHFKKLKEIIENPQV